MDLHFFSGPHTQTADDEVIRFIERVDRLTRSVTHSDSLVKSPVQSHYLDWHRRGIK